MPLAYITRVETFCAAHKLYNPLWDDKQNDEAFGKCANKLFHGHNYKLFVTVKGTPNVNTGFIINAKELGKIIQSYIIDKVDHRNLNEDVDFLKNTFTSTENLCIAFWQQLFEPLKNIGTTLYKISLQETDKIIGEYLGE